MTFGINTFLFTSQITNERTKWVPKLKEWGFDFVEIALKHPANIDPLFVRKELDENGLLCKQSAQQWVLEC